jgi:single-strand DNA-binding protein
MFNQALLIVSGNVANDPFFQTVRNEIPKLTLRVAWTTRRFDAGLGEWVDGNTSYANVTCWRKLAENLSLCLRKGDPVLLRGKLEVRNFDGRDGQRKTAVDVEAITLGHDLTRGVARFRRLSVKPGQTAQEAAELAAAENGLGVPGGEDGEIGSETAALAALGDGDEGAVPGPDAAAGDHMFDDSAIDELAKETGSVATPF